MRFSPKACVLLVALGLTCDGASAELERTKQSLQQITSERDQLKARLERAEARVSELQQQIDGLESAAVAARASKGDGTSAKAPKPRPKAGSRARPP